MGRFLLEMVLYEAEVEKKEFWEKLPEVVRLANE